MIRADEAPTNDAVAAGPTGPLTLSKHEGAGNDFLVLLAPSPGAVAPKGATGDGRPTTSVVTAAQARALCDRRRGVGADGLIVVGPGEGTDLAMVLFNADGTEAEMSGNGIRCLAQATVSGGLVGPGSFTVATGGGVRRVEYRPGALPGLASASVDMGPVALGAEQPAPLPGGRACLADVGNPHLVVLGDVELGQIDLAAIGQAAAGRYPGGLNVEIVTPGPGPDALSLRVWERGVGETMACGTGSCAAAAVARAWGVVGDRVRVHNPGGTLDVGLGPGPDGPAVLGGPVRHVADVLVDVQALCGTPEGGWR